MSGQRPIDRVPRPQDAPEIRDEDRERLTRKAATLAQTDRREEGERVPPDRPADDGSERAGSPPGDPGATP